MNSPAEAYAFRAIKSRMAHMAIHDTVTPGRSWPLVAVEVLYTLKKLESLPSVDPEYIDKNPL